MDISTYLQLKQEVDLLNELLLDKDQLLIFNTFSTVINFKKMITEITEISKFTIDFNDVNEDKYNDVFNSLNLILKRQNQEDKKIMKFIKLKGQNDV